MCVANLMQFYLQEHKQEIPIQPDSQTALHPILGQTLHWRSRNKFLDRILPESMLNISLPASEQLDMRKDVVKLDDDIETYHLEEQIILMLRKCSRFLTQFSF